MHDSKYINDIGAATFQNAVVEQSRSVPVLVDFWADWCGPCKMQMPILAKLITEFDGKFLLAKVNTDVERDLAREHGIRSLPTMRLYKDGDVVEEILGAQTESTLRAILDRYIERVSDTMRQTAMDHYRQGQTERALELLREAYATEPDNHRVVLDLVQVTLEQGRVDEAEEMLMTLPREVRDEKEASRMLALLGFAKTCRDAPVTAELEQRLQSDTNDLDARYLLAARQVMDNQPEAAMDNLLAIIQKDRTFREDAGRSSLLALFELLEDEGELVSRYRRKLFNIMH